MVRKAIYSPHYDFFIDQSKRTASYNMDSFHIHKKYEIYYLLEGSRKYFINDSVYIVNAGSLVIIDEDAIHKTANMGDLPHTRIVLNFSGKFIEDFSDDIKQLNLMSIFKTNFAVLPLSYKYKLIVENILNKLVQLGNLDLDYELSSSSKAQSNKQDFQKVLLKTNLTELLITIKEYISILEEKDAASTQINNNKVDKIIKYIGANYTQDLTLTSLAEQFYISPFYLSKIFKKSTNLSIVEYINSLRIREAKDLLEHSSSKVSQIAELVGFASSSHFSRTFKTATGLSPQQYKKYYASK